MLPLYLERAPTYRLRATDDADAVVACTTHQEWVALQMELHEVGIQPVSGDPNAPICRMRTARGHLLDFMPIDPDVLGFGNRWFRQGFERSIVRSIGDNLDIRIFPPPLFVAAKAEAYRDRGIEDPWASHDLEDLLTLIACRPSLLTELTGEGEELRSYLACFALELLSLDRFEELVYAHIGEQEDEVIAVLKAISRL